MDQATRERWHMRWKLGVLPYAIVVAIASYFWFNTGPGAASETGLRTIYRYPQVAIAVYYCGAVLVYYAAYAIATAIGKLASPREAKFHLTFWALIPPLWFFVEWFFLVKSYDPADIAIVRGGQDVVGKIWAGVLAVLLAAKLGDVAAVAATPESTKAGGDDAPGRVIPEYSDVKIVRITGDASSRIISSSYDSPKIPAIGDVGIVVDRQKDGSYIVENVEGDGYTAWLAWFRRSELVVVPRGSRDAQPS